MKSILPLLCLFLACTVARAQEVTCDYQALLREGRALFEKQQYRAAIKKFNAARTCDPSKAAEVDKEVDRVFNAIEAQRDEAKVQREEALQQKQRAETERNRATQALQLAETMRDSAQKAGEGRKLAERQKTAYIESNDLQFLGNKYKSERDFNKAATYYQRALKVLSDFPLKDSALVIKYNILKEEVAAAKALRDKQLVFDYLMRQAEANVHAGITNYTYAYDKYFEALALKFDSSKVVKGLLDLEANLCDKKCLKTRLQGRPYYELMARSAEANLALNIRENMYDRLNAIVYLEPSAVDYFRNSALKKAVVDGISSSWQQAEIYIGLKSYFPNLNYGNKSRGKFLVNEANLPAMINGVTLGASTAEGEKWRMGFDICFAWPNYLWFPPKVRSADLLRSYFQSELSIYSQHDIMLMMNKKWLNTIFRIQGIFGITYGTASGALAYTPYSYQFITPAPNLQSLMQKDTVGLQGFKYENSSVTYSLNQYGAGNVGVKVSSPDSYSSSYLNLYLGARLCWRPQRARKVSIFTEAAYNFLLASFKDKASNSLPDAVLADISSRYSLTSEAKNEVSTLYNHLKANDVINNWRGVFHVPEFNSRLSLKVGVAFRL